MYYSIFTANELKRKHEIENGFKYDLVIRARLDFIWQDYVLPEMFPKLGDRLMYIIRDDYVYLSGLTTNDKFLGASSRNMDEFCLIFKAMRKMYNKGRSIQATDIATFYFKHHYTPVLIGDKSHYAKHHFYFNKGMNSTKKLYIEVYDELTHAIAELFLTNGHHAHIKKIGYNVDELLCFDGVRLVEERNPKILFVFIITRNDTHSILVEKFLRKTRKLRKIVKHKVILISEYAYKVQGAKITDKTCYIPDIAWYVYRGVKNESIEDCYIGGSIKHQLEPGDIVLYDTWEKGTKIRCELEQEVVEVTDKGVSLKFHGSISRGDRKFNKKYLRVFATDMKYIRLNDNDIIDGKITTLRIDA